MTSTTADTLGKPTGIYNPEAFITVCRLIATRAHLRQYRRDGTTPYITHPLAVEAVVRHLGLICRAVAFLHDTVEDTHVTSRALGDLLELGRMCGEGAPQWDEKVTTAVVDCVGILTHYDCESYEAYITRVVDSGNWVALAVKAADVRHNLSCDPKPGAVTRYVAAQAMIRRRVLASPGSLSCVADLLPDT